MAPELSVSQFVAVANQTLEYALDGVVIVGELANYRVSKNKWVYFDLKDDEASVKFFGTVFMLPGPLEEGMILKVRGAPRLHPRYGFSVNIVNIQLAGEGTIKKAASLLEAKLAAEGLFAPERKRPLPFPPSAIGLITSSESAAYADFIKVLNARWGGMNVRLADVQVQGEDAPSQIVTALERFNKLADLPDVLVITRGGGSSEDLGAFSDERLVRAVAASRIPTLVAIGHEIDVSLAELAADRRASTPSNAAELLVPDKKDVFRELKTIANQLGDLTARQLSANQAALATATEKIDGLIEYKLTSSKENLSSRQQLLTALDPALPLKRGYVLVRNANNQLVRRAADVAQNAKIALEVSDAFIKAKVEGINAKNTR